ncbi:MAG TPA: acyl-CoA dehydrogenase family protein [Dehalococcoidia bacterium]
MVREAERTAAGGMPDTAGMNFYEADPNLGPALRRLAAPEEFQRAVPLLREVGEAAGGELDRLARVADANPPVLERYDARGQRVDEVVFHPAYEAMARMAFERFGFAAMSHRPGVRGWPGRVPHLVKYALSYVFVQAEFGLFCPVSMTDSAARVLRLFGDEALQARYVPRLTATRYEDLYTGAMFMTERQGGSDVGAATTTARRAGDVWTLHGEKWFCSNVSADVILTLARPEGAPDGTRGLGLFLVPKHLPDGSRNRYRIERLKNKLGTRDMATGEVVLDGAVAWVVGDLERGFRQMAEMVNVSRLSNAMRAAAIMRRSLLESVVHARGRVAFGRRLFDLPLMRETLLPLLLDTEACTALVLHAAATLDRADAGSERDRRLIRILTPLAKLYVTKRARFVAGEAMEVRGGNGYVEEWVNPRLLRDAYLGSIWEGSSNVVALDVARAMQREGAGDTLLDDLASRLAGLRDADVRRVAERAADVLARTRARCAEVLALDAAGREPLMGRLAERLALLTMATLLLEEADDHAAAGLGYRKLLAATAYLRRMLLAPDPLADDGVAVRWLDELVDGGPVPAEAAHRALSGV